jgi:hypothetical protein
MEATKGAEIVVGNCLLPLPVRNSEPVLERLTGWRFRRTFHLFTTGVAGIAPFLGHVNLLHM